VRNQYAFEFKAIHILKFFFKVLASKMKIMKIDFALNFKPPLWFQRIHNNFIKIKAKFNGTLLMIKHNYWKVVLVICKEMWLELGWIC
jgi:hypothetical protein